MKTHDSRQREKNVLNNFKKKNSQAAVVLTGQHDTFTNDKNKTKIVNKSSSHWPL
jgi:hypothetical protein